MGQLSLTRQTTRHAHKTLMFAGKNDCSDSYIILECAVYTIVSGIVNNIYDKTGSLADMFVRPQLLASVTHIHLKRKISTVLRENKVRYLVQTKLLFYGFFHL